MEKETDIPLSVSALPAPEWAKKRLGALGRGVMEKFGTFSDEPDRLLVDETIDACYETDGITPKMSADCIALLQTCLEQLSDTSDGRAIAELVNEHWFVRLTASIAA